MTNAEKFIADGYWFRDLGIVTDPKHGMYQIILNKDTGGIEVIYFNERAVDKDYTEEFLEDFLYWLDEDTEDD